MIFVSLQTNPESRPTLDQTLQNSFFTGPGTYIPDQLPECALRVPPIFQNAQLSEGYDIKNKLSEGYDIKNKGLRNDTGVRHTHTQIHLVIFSFDVIIFSFIII